MSELTKAVHLICDEKGLDYDAVISTIEASLAAAYRKDYGNKNQNIKVKFDPETQESQVYDVKTVVEDATEEEVETQDSKESEKEEGEEEKRRFNPKTEIQLSDAQIVKNNPEVGEEIWTSLEIPESYGRMAAQTAKQVIIQKLRESERDMIFNEFKEKENEVVGGVVQRREGRNVLIDLGKVSGYLQSEEQVPGERYEPGDRVKVYIKEVRQESKGPEIILSRTCEEILKRIFYLEIPEVANGLIEIKGVVREPGFRSKVAIWTDADNIDPIGSCVGQKGGRIQTIINELGGERVDIVEYSEDSVKFIGNALSPAKVLNIEIDEENKRAKVRVSSAQFSLAIGKKGQNVRLAARLSGWNIDIVEYKESEYEEDVTIYSSEHAQEGENISKVEEADNVEETEVVKEKKEENDKKTEDPQIIEEAQENKSDQQSEYDKKTEDTKEN